MLAATTVPAPAPSGTRSAATLARDPVIAADELYGSLVQPDLRLVLFYCAPDHDLAALARELRRRFGDVPLAGCTTAGEIAPHGYLSGAIAAVSFAGPDIDARIARIPLHPFDATATGEQVRAALDSLQLQGGAASPANTFALLLIDGLAMQEELTVSCIYRNLRGIELVGGSAADDTRFGATHVFAGERFEREVAALVVIRTTLPFVTFRTQHFIKSDRRMVVTKADPARRIVYEINGLPAGREFARLVGLEMAELTPLIFATHPVVVRVGGEYYVRSIAKVNDDESLTFFCAIDEGIVLTIAEGIDLIENLDSALARVRATLGEPQVVLGYDCILRRLELERDGLKDRVGQLLAANHVLGFATYGEQFNAMHVNQTFTGVAIGRRR